MRCEFVFIPIGSNTATRIHACGGIEEAREEVKKQFPLLIGKLYQEVPEATVTSSEEYYHRNGRVTPFPDLATK